MLIVIGIALDRVLENFGSPRALSEMRVDISQQSEECAVLLALPETCLAVSSASG